MDEAETGDRFCPDCGYNLRGLSAGRCPECGFVVGGAEGATRNGVIVVGAMVAACIACWSPLFAVASWSAEGVRRERVKALGAYACAPLAWTPVCAALFHAYSASAESGWRYIAKEGW